MTDLSINEVIETLTGELDKAKGDLETCQEIVGKIIENHCRIHGGTFESSRKIVYQMKAGEAMEYRDKKVDNVVSLVQYKTDNIETSGVGEDK